MCLAQISTSSKKNPFHISLYSNEREALAPRGAFLNAYGYQRRYWQNRARRPPFLAGIGVLILLMGIFAMNTFARQGQVQQQAVAPKSVSPTTTPLSSSSASPFLFGSNLILPQNPDSPFNSSIFPLLVQKEHIQIIRIPVHEYSDSLSTSIAKTAQTIESLGIVPVIVLHGGLNSDALKVDTALIQTMNTIFTSGTVYYEFGDEDDALGESAAQYVSAWNDIIPQLASLASQQAHFIGPATYRYNRDFLTTFLQQARPSPDAISWHEYSCVSSGSKDQCLSHLSNWTQDIVDARMTMQKVLQKTLPIMITEWNYAANATANDGKSNDSTFMNSWTTRAIQTLAAGNVFAAMQSALTGSAASLIENDQLTAQGTAFQQQYNSLVTKISFEDGSMGGFEKSNTMTNIQNSTDVALDGQRSLKITVSQSTSHDYPTLWFDGPPSTANPRIGQTIVAYVYVPPRSPSLVANVYVEDSSHRQCDACHFPGWRVWATLTPGMWTRVSYTVAPGVSMPSTGYGISFSTTSPAAVTTTFYVDAFGWGSADAFGQG